jgi:hypothetical protein
MYINCAYTESYVGLLLQSPLATCTSTTSRDNVRLYVRFKIYNDSNKLSIYISISIYIFSNNSRNLSNSSQLESNRIESNRVESINSINSSNSSNSSNSIGDKTKECASLACVSKPNGYLVHGMVI